MRRAFCCLFVLGGFAWSSVMAQPPVPTGLPPLPVPAANPQTKAKIDLGRQLYFDKRLSIDDTVSCASCHDPKKGWSNGAQFATGVRGQVGGRNSPTIVNSAYQTKATFWDGRAAQSSPTAGDALEAQALGPIQNPIEMDMKLDALLPKLNKIDGYKQQFQAVFGTDVTADGIAKAIASFERTVISGNAPVDRYIGGDSKSLSAAAERGFKLFRSGNKANCTACHNGRNFTDGAYHNLGVGMDAKEPDLGRFAVTKSDGDKGAFKTPTLREIARTAPYMHDGSLKTLEEVVEFYAKGGRENSWLDEEMLPLKLSAEEKADLVTFLKEGFVGDRYPDSDPPKLP